MLLSEKILYVLYELLKTLVCIFFNTLNILLAGNMPPLGTVCAIVEDEGRFLIVENSRGGWSFPGGFMRWRETPAATAVRECEEETGLRLQVRGVVGFHVESSAGFTSLSTLTHVYYGEVVGGKLRGSIEGRPRWLDEAELRARLSGQSAAMFAEYERCQTRPGKMNARHV
ncbi:MAG: NUDIX hydrolase [Chloroflexota bacterium]|nr:NUDIX hydrolase [Chloroflexota bacterium]